MIITDEDALRVQCEPVLPEEVADLTKRLEEGLRWSAAQGRPGVGLACPQIGVPKSMAIVRLNDGPSIDLINAKITKMYDQFEFEGEGCLSFPDRWEKTLRYREVVVEGNMVPPFKFIVTGFAAVVVQHEIDHLKGVLLPDVAIQK